VICPTSFSSIWATARLNEELIRGAEYPLAASGGAYTGANLFAAENDLITLHRVLEMTIPPPSAARADVPADLDGIVMKALERDPERRYASATATRSSRPSITTGTNSLMGS